MPLAQTYRVPLADLVGAPDVGDPRIRLQPRRVNGRTVLPLTRPGGSQAWKIVPAPAQAGGQLHRVAADAARGTGDQYGLAGLDLAGGEAGDLCADVRDGPRDVAAGRGVPRSADAGGEPDGVRLAGHQVLGAAVEPGDVRREAHNERRRGARTPAGKREQQVDERSAVPDRAAGHRNPSSHVALAATSSVPAARSRRQRTMPLSRSRTPTARSAARTPKCCASTPAATRRLATVPGPGRSAVCPDAPEGSHAHQWRRSWERDGVQATWGHRPGVEVGDGHEQSCS